MIVPIDDKNRSAVKAFFIEHWGSSVMVISSGSFTIQELEGFLYVVEGSIVGLISYVNYSDKVEIISLDSLQEGKGIGTKLFERVEAIARQEKKKLELITTNDNLNALKFWQKRGFRIVQVLPDAVDQARKIKPSIPEKGDFDIPIHDELLLVKIL